MISKSPKQTTRIKHAATAVAPYLNLIQKGPLQPQPAMAATRPRRRGNPWIRASAPPPRHLFLYMPPTTRVRRHEIAALPHRRCMPPLPSAVWQDGRHHRCRRRQRPRRWPKDVTARVGLGPPVSPKRGRHGGIDRSCRRGCMRLAAAIWIASVFSHPPRQYLDQETS
jgi:hypothetical protein